MTNLHRNISPLVKSRIFFSNKVALLLLLLPTTSSTTENVLATNSRSIERHLRKHNPSRSGSNDSKYEGVNTSNENKHEGKIVFQSSEIRSHSSDVDLLHLDGATSSLTSRPFKGTQSKNEDYDGLGFWSAFVNSLSMIIATEIGDKTFFIAAVMSMKNDCFAVFSGAILALAVMTVLSSFMGLILPQLMPRQYTHFFGGILFLYFGVKLIKEGRSIPKGKCSDELEEVEEELTHSTKKGDKENADGEVEEDGMLRPPESQREKVFVQALTLTFLAEWGDRSQIATIALAASKDPIGVNIGAILGHTLCTGMAVIGGRMLAAKIEERTVTIISGVIFLCFGLHALFMENV